MQVLGDSFIYHQIRKMVGLAIFALRYIDDASRLAWVKSVIQDSGVRYVPLAPSLGLMLERVLFQKENKTHGRGRKRSAEANLPDDMIEAASGPRDTSEAQAPDQVP